MELWELQDLLMIFEDAEEAHRNCAHSCAGFNDFEGDLYHSGMSSAFQQVADFLKQRLSELDSESGR